MHHVRLRGLLGLAAASTIAIGGSAALAPTSWATGIVTANSNGEAGKTPTAILTDAKKATESARSAEVSGTVSDSGNRFVLDIKVGNGAGGGTLQVDGAKFNLVVHPPKLWLKADKASWQKAGAQGASALLANRWLRTTTSNKDFADFAKLLDLKKLVGALSPGGRVVKKPVTTFHGAKVVPLFDTGTDGGTLYVSATGKPYILGLVGVGKEAGSRVVFAHYNTTRVPPAPKGAINLGNFSGSGSSGSGSSGGGSSSSTSGGSGFSS